MGYLKQAIDISLNIATGDNAARFFIMLKRQKNQLFACLMLQFLNKMRSDLLDNINKVTKKQFANKILGDQASWNGN